MSLSYRRNEASLGEVTTDAAVLVQVKVTAEASTSETVTAEVTIRLSPKLT